MEVDNSAKGILPDTAQRDLEQGPDFSAHMNLVPEHLSLENSIEENLLNSFSTLPPTEQHSITTRVGMLTDKLLWTKNDSIHQKSKSSALTNMFESSPAMTTLPTPLTPRVVDLRKLDSIHTTIWQEYPVFSKIPMWESRSSWMKLPHSRTVVFYWTLTVT